MLDVQYVNSQRAEADSSGEDSDMQADLRVQPAPDVEESMEDAELDNHGQWSPLPLEPEDYEGELPVGEEEDAQAIADARDEVSSRRNAGVWGRVG